MDRAGKRLRMLHDSLTAEGNEFLHRCLDVLEETLVIRENADFFTTACVAIDDFHSVVDRTILPVGYSLTPVALCELLISAVGCSWEAKFRQLR